MISITQASAAIYEPYQDYIKQMHSSNKKTPSSCSVASNYIKLAIRVTQHALALYNSAGVCVFVLAEVVVAFSPGDVETSCWTPEGEEETVK